MKTQITIFVLGALLVLASAQNNSSNNSNSTSSSVAATSATGTAYYGMECSSSKGNGNDVCAQVDKDWCCLYTSTTYAGVTTDGYVCTYSPDYYEQFSDNLDDVADDVADALDIEYEQYCANAVLFRLSFAAILLALGLLF
mmetsp:Transcript_15834/g.15258  ORF Transcript_15834/g.15258 Transcript_15834/m.15258 type:complete len:141 (+) Transcript_15834:35-457(+)|eukprot:CAMPEP_0170540106 /NCGR_PEP_ID=MMETSP0211-20121228/137_1 /TAXON_ID=311385 /ORGANISM="Pseudokeronopsis sp., Strain OXSARD2" /LENGTH=140 /DNA_ID=CAMNT_0010842389 /DNA_START=35 /DNA_END=457 /DNA_ORIENTATION=-